jgi:hypothetical protein
MAIVVTTNNTQATAPIEIALIDKSGANVILTLSIQGRPPITHSFTFDEGTLLVPIDLKKGHYECTFVIQAFKHGALNGMYASSLEINQQLAASASGKIPSGKSFDVGAGDFDLIVV